ncbi:MAG: lipocalin-like domain-containing protein [Chloroflexota bacterium]
MPLPGPVATVAYPPVTLPEDDAPHDYLTEWWYYTGHLETDTGERFGFELVTFQSVRGNLPVAYVGHFAVTDQQRRTFQYDHRSKFGARVIQQDAFDLDVDGWRMRGGEGDNFLNASMTGYGIDLALRPTKPAVLHDEDGLISFGEAGDSYYVTRTRLEIQGTIVDHGERKRVTGLAWFDHQWGNFLVLGGGWDWVSAQLSDGSDIMVNTVRDDRGVLQLAYGTFVGADGSVKHLPSSAFSLEPRGAWVSPRSGARYPSGWTVRVKEPLLELVFEPVILDQELITEGTTGQTYWEGQNRVTGWHNGRQVNGWGYVELTGYAGK